MTLVDRFVCRREGHVPSFTFHASSLPTTAMCTCVRCGKWIEVTHPAAAQAVAEEAAKPQKRGDQSVSP